MNKTESYFGLETMEDEKISADGGKTSTELNDGLLTDIEAWLERPLTNSEKEDLNEIFIS